MQVIAISKVFRLAETLNQKLTKRLGAAKVMKLTTILLLGACLQLSARGVSQTITLSLKDAPIQKLFREIERQTNYTFLIESSLFAKAKKVTVSAQSLPLNQVLELCFKDQPLSYSISGKIITVAEKQDKAAVNINVYNNQLPVDIKGRVINSKGEPIADATVSVQGSDKRTITNSNGEFTIPGVRDNAVVIISHVQYETLSLPIKGNGLLTATLQLRVSSLDELQIIAYGTTSRRFTTGNVATVKASDIEKQPVQNPLLTLQGRVPGIEVTQLTGMPGAGLTVRIQGRNSISSGLDPLVIIDGVPFPTQLTYSGYEGIVQNGSPLNYINPSDIESIDILKDADATAIYGSRAANGAILITTKKGKAGRTKVDINFQQGLSKVARKVDMLNSQQYLEMRYEALKNDGIALSTLTQTGNYDLTVWDTTGKYTDWQKELIGSTAQYTNLNSTVSGGANNVQYLISGTYNRQTNVFPGDFDDKRGGLHFNVTGSSKDQKFKIQLSGNYMYDRNRLPGIDLTQAAVLMTPNAPDLYTSDGKLNWAPNTAGNSTFLNPLARIFGASYNNTTKNLVQNINLDYRILKGLDLRTSVGYTNTLSSLYLPVQLEVERPERRATAQRSTNNVERDMNSWIFEPQLQYSGSLSKGKLEALLGGTILQNKAKILSVYGAGYSNDLLMQTVSAAPTVFGNSSTTESKFNGLFARINYIWSNKYILNFTGRRDGSSKFGDANKLHDFGSIAGAWIFSEEGFIVKNFHFLSFGKIRGSYGTTGNDQIGDFGNLSLYDIQSSQILYQGGIALQANKLPNPYLQWEETRKLQVGADLGFINDKILIGATYARNRSSNQLISYTLPSTTGFTTIAENLPALIQNTSWEFTLNTTNIKTRDFLWTISTNLTIPRNKVVNFPGIEQTPYASGTSGVIVGQGLGVVKTYKYAGVDPATGKYQVYDKDGNVTTTPTINDKAVLISNFTKFYGGLQNSISYKGIQLDISFQFVRQIGPKDMYYYGGYQASTVPGSFTTSGFTNHPVSVLNRWQKSDDDAKIAKYSTKSGAAGVSMYPPESDVWYSYDASFIRLKNLSLSWQLPKNWLKQAKLQNVRLYLQGQNWATITNFRGLDPETKNSFTLPPLKVTTIGIYLEL